MSDDNKPQEGDIIVEHLSIDRLNEMIAEHERLNPDYEVRSDVTRSIKFYVTKGVPPGGFVRAVLENSLMDALGRADSYNRASIFQICQYVYANVPASLRGSPEAVDAWITRCALERAEKS